MASTSELEGLTVEEVAMEQEEAAYRNLHSQLLAPCSGKVFDQPNPSPGCGRRDAASPCLPTATIALPGSECEG